MKWLYLSILPILSTFKINAQGYFSKGKLKTTADYIKFNGFMHFFAAISLIVFTVRELPCYQTILYALCISIIAISFQCFYVLSFKNGAVSLSATIVNFSLTIPIVFSAIVFNEKITQLKWIGLVLAVIALILISTNSSKNDNSKKGIKITKKWLLFITLATLTSGFSAVIQQSFSRSEFSNQKELFTALMYVFATIFSFILLPFVKKSNQPLYKSDAKINIGLVFTGLALGFYNLLSVSAMAVIPAGEFFPTLAGLNILISVVISSITFKEFPSIKQWIGIAVMLCAVVLINLV